MLVASQFRGRKNQGSGQEQARLGAGQVRGKTGQFRVNSVQGQVRSELENVSRGKQIRELRSDQLQTGCLGDMDTGQVNRCEGRGEGNHTLYHFYIL